MQKRKRAWRLRQPSEDEVADLDADERTTILAALIGERKAKLRAKRAIVTGGSARGAQPRQRRRRSFAVNHGPDESAPQREAMRRERGSESERATAPAIEPPAQNALQIKVDVTRWAMVHERQPYGDGRWRCVVIGMCKGSKRRLGQPTFVGPFERAVAAARACALRAKFERARIVLMPFAE